ncbi:MAG: ATP-binding protein [Kangiellaceae bacterium]|nr:ATP-binding protein [Kangiellaceae bacterium]
MGALSNLIENAIDASTDKQPVCIEFSITQNYRFKIVVKDTGSGISEQLKKKIFEPFYSSKNNGNGLGLAIVQGVVIEHQGQISVRDNADKGSVFEIELPLFSESGRIKNSRADIQALQLKGALPGSQQTNDIENIEHRLVLQGVSYDH